MNKKYIWILVVVVVLVLGYTVVKNQSASNEKIKIGVIGPFSGASANYGEFMNRGLELALADMDQKTRDRIELVREDDKCTGPDAVSALNKLIQIGGVKYTIGPLCNASTVAVEKVYDDNNVVSFTSGVPSKQIADMGPNHFTLLPEIEYLMKALSGYMRQNNFAKPGILYVTDAFGQENYDKFKVNFESAGGSIAVAEGVEKGAMDLRTQILKIRDANPDSIVIMLTGGSVVSALKELDRQGLGGLPKFAVHAFQNPDVLKGAAKEAEGIIYPYPASNVSTAKSVAYVKNYSAKYNQSAELYSTNVYDSLTLLVSAIEKCGYKNVKCVEEKVSATKDYEGASGLLSLDSRGIAVFQQTLMKTVRNGQFENLNK